MINTHLLISYNLTGTFFTPSHERESRKKFYEFNEHSCHKKGFTNNFSIIEDVLLM